MKLVQLKSGTIDLVEVQNNALFIQFNCSCMDALPYCKAMCCKMRPMFNVELKEGEDKKFSSLDTTKGKVLAIVNNYCNYLNEENKCSIQKDKPSGCKEWHCSPGGIGEDIKTRAQGWLLVPTQRAL